MIRSAAVIILFLIAVPAPAEITPVSATVTAERVNLRVSPSLKSEITGQVSRGDRVGVILTDGDWCAVNPPPDMPAWVSADYVEEGRVTADRLNVRSGPGISYGLLTRIGRGTEVEVLKEKDGWLRIPVPERTRLWISARYLSTPQPPADKETVPESFTPFPAEKKEGGGRSRSPAASSISFSLFLSLSPRHRSRSGRLSAGLSSPSPSPIPDRLSPTAGRAVYGFGQ